MRLHHIALGASDVAVLAEFYRDRFGLPELRRHHHGDGSLRSVWLDLGGAILMIEGTDAPPRRVEGIGAGPFLLAFEIDESERAEREAELERAGYPIEDRTDFTSYFRDPEGNRAALSFYPRPQG